MSNKKKHDNLVNGLGIDPDADTDNEIIGYCAYTKEPIYVKDDYFVKHGQLYSVEGWKEEMNIIDEINFDEV